MTPFEFGDVLLLNTFPFSDRGGIKKRPALVLADTGDQDLILCRITGESTRDRYDLGLKEWKECGLLLPSSVRVSKMAVLSKRLVVRKLGRLGSPDRRKIRAVLRELFAL